MQFVLKKVFPALMVILFLCVAALRLWNLDSLPASLYWEEAALGYDAYSLLKTGKDHHGNAWPIVAVESFGDWKPSGYFYALIPFIQLFGLEPWVVRLPSALAGIAIVAAVSVLSGNLARVGVKTLPKKWQWIVVPSAQLFGVIVTGLSPWAIQFSRAGFEANLATACIAWGSIFAYWVIVAIGNDKKVTKMDWVFSISSVILFGYSMYTYHSARMVVPLLLLVLAMWGVVELRKTNSVKKWLPLLSSSCIVLLLLIAPFLLAIGSKSTTQRFAETSIFSDLSIIEASNELKESTGNAWWSRVLYHRYVLFGQKVIENYLSHWSPQYLFVSGDANPRHSTQFIGTLYFADAAVLLGTFWLLWQTDSKNKKLWLFLIWWIVVGVLPAAITQASPHALRTLLMMPALLAFLAAGGTLLALEIVGWIVFQVKEAWFKPWMKVLACVVLLGCIEGSYLAQFMRYWRYYSSVYPVQAATEWQYGYKEVTGIVDGYRRDHVSTPIYFSRSMGRPAMYYWFFTKTDPSNVQAQDQNAPQDQGEYLQYENIHFIRSLGEVNTPGLVVMLDNEWQQFQADSKWKAQIVAQTTPLRAGQPYWVVAEVMQ